MPVHYVTYEGIKFPPAYNSEHSLSFAHNEFLVRDDDIFNITYPKSGTRGGQQGWPRVERGRRGVRALEPSPGVLQMVNLLLWWGTGLFWGFFTAVVVHGQGSTITWGDTDSVLRVLLTTELWHSDILPS